MTKNSRCTFYRAERLVAKLLCTLIICGGIFVVAPNAASATDTTILGRWQINSEASTNAVDELKGIRVDKRKRHGKRRPPKSKTTQTTQNTQDRYWQTANAGEVWQHSREITHTGPLQRVLESENLEILQDASEFIIVYADGYERRARPNAAGRVFTAKGDELVVDEIGHTLTYWQDDQLILETRLKNGGQMLEQLTTSADGQELTLSITIDRRDWKWIARFERSYARALSPGAP